MAVGRAARASDQELMRRVQTDDSEAFGVLYARLAPTALRVAAAMLRADGDHARDAVQEGFLSIWRARASYEPERGDVHTWAFAIVRNRAIDGMRRNGRYDRGRHLGDEAAVQLHAPGDVQADAVDDDDARRLRTLLAGLPLAQREVIALAYFGQLTHSEIAQQLTLPLGTVKGRMRLGLIKLRDHLVA